MATMNRRTRTSLGMLLAGAAGTFVFFASPAGADPTSQTSGGAVAVGGSVASGTCAATNDSVCSGSGRAEDDSTSSGSAVAVGGSVSSGCATAVHLSTASGGPCPAAAAPTTVVRRPSAAPAVPAARPAATAPGARSLALTGSSTGELATVGAVALVLGGVLVGAARRRDDAAIDLSRPAA